MSDHINRTETTQQTQVSKLHKESSFFILIYVFIMLQQSISSDKQDFSIQYFIISYWCQRSFKYTLFWMCVDYNFLLSVSSTVEHEQIQKRTFTNWINAQLAKVCWEIIFTCDVSKINGCELVYSVWKMNALNTNLYLFYASQSSISTVISIKQLIFLTT